MCIGGNRTKQPALQERTTPDVKPAPTDETVRIQPVSGVKLDDFQSQQRLKTYDDIDNTSKTDPTISMTDTGINY